MESTNILLKFSVMIMDNSGLDLMEIGNELVNSGFDELSDSGFWIWEIETENRFYSPGFRKSIGFSNEIDFPSLNSSWRNIIKKEDLPFIMKDLERVLHNKTGEDEFIQKITCFSKSSKPLTFLCSGKILRTEGRNKYLLGTHTLKN